MSSSILTITQTQLNLYGYPLFVILGNIGNAFIIILFSRQRQNACSLYLLSSAIMNVLYLTLYGSIQIFSISYNGPTPTEFVLCKIFNYMTNVIGQVAKTLTVLACIDRFLITNNRATFRALSTPKRAKYLIFFSVIFWLLVSIHIPIMTTIVNGQCTRFGTYATLYAIYIIVFVGLLPPVISGMLGFLTYRNMRQVRNRVQPIGNNTNHANIAIRRRDRDLLKLVISEIFVYVITAGLFPLIRLEMMISQYVISNKSIQYLQIEVLTLNIAYLLLFINSGAAFYTYISVSKSFRQDFKQLIMNVNRKLRRQRIAPAALTVNGT